MINRTVNVSVTPSPRELEDELWKMNRTEQADVVLAMVQRVNGRALTVYDRVEKFADAFKELSREERRDAIMLFKHILEVMQNADDSVEKEK